MEKGGYNLVIQAAKSAFDAITENDQRKIPELYNRLRQIAPCALEIIGGAIKENPAEFVCLE